MGSYQLLLMSALRSIPLHGPNLATRFYQLFCFYHRFCMFQPVYYLITAPNIAYDSLLGFQILINCLLHQQPSPAVSSSTCSCCIINLLLLYHHQHAESSAACFSCIIISLLISNLLLVYHYQPAPASSATCSCFINSPYCCIISLLL